MQGRERNLYRETGGGGEAGRDHSTYGGSRNKSMAPGRPRRHGWLRGGRERLGRWAGSGTGESTVVTCGHNCSPFPHSAV